MKKILLIFLVTSIVLYSCQTSDDDPTPLLEETDVSGTDEDAAARSRHGCDVSKLLTGTHSKAWKANKYFINGVDFTAYFMECSLDNIQTFYTNGRYLEVEGATKCDPNDPTIFDQGTFEFSDDYSQFLLSATHLEATFDTVELSVNFFKIKYPDPVLGEVEIWLVPAKKKKHYH